MFIKLLNSLPKHHICALYLTGATIVLTGCNDDINSSMPVSEPSANTQAASTTQSATEPQNSTNSNTTTVIPTTAQTKIEWGNRPFYLVNDMEPSQLKDKLNSCENNTAKVSDFSIGHRGAALQFPEHSKESYLAAIKQGAGIVECDVAFTKDMELVCRHAQNDLHTTTNILATDLAKKCTKPFTPATFNADGSVLTPASAECRTSDITLAEFKTLKAKMDDSTATAKTVTEYLKSSNTYRTDLYATYGTLMTHKESIALINSYGRKFTPELKTPSVNMPYTYNGVTMTQDDLATKMIQEYISAGIAPSRVFAQSFQPRDIYYWIKQYPAFGKQAVYLDDYAKNLNGLESDETFQAIYDKGVRYIGPALPKLMTVDSNNKMIPSNYAKNAKGVGLNLIAWTLERNQPVASGNGWYYSQIKPALKRDGDNYVMLDVLAKDVGVKGVFSDWPATVTYYANCMGL